MNPTPAPEPESKGCPFARLHSENRGVKPSPKREGWKGCWIFSPKRQLVIIAVAAAMLCVVSMSLLKRVELLSQQDVEDSLHGVMQATEQALDNWIESERASVEVWAADSHVVDAAQELLAEEQSPETLIQSQAQKEIRKHLGLLVRREYLGFLLIGPDNKSLASAHDANVGTTNLLVQQPERLQRAWEGETVIFAPQESDVPLQLGEGKRDVSMFIGSPVRDDRGAIIGLLAFRIDPYRQFVQVIQRGKIGNTGETYVYDENGEILSKTLFGEDAGAVGSELHSSFGATRSLSAPEAGSRSFGRVIGSFDDYRGVPVIGSTTWHADLGLGYTTKIDRAEAFDTFKAVRGVWVTLTAVALTLIAALYFVHVRAGRSNNAVRAHLQAVVSNAREGIISINGKGIIETWNPGAEKVFGYTEQEMIGQNVKVLMPEPHQSEHDQNLANYLATGKGKVVGFTRIVEGLNKEGNSFPLELSINEMWTGNTLKFVATVRDITGQIAREKELTAARDKAEAASRSKSSFLANMSHEIRTPMNAILGFSRLLQFDSSLSEPQRDRINSINRSGEHLLVLINDILEMSKIEAGHEKLETEPIPLRTMLEDLELMFRRLAEEKGVELRCQVDSDVPDHVGGDEAKLRQILINLLGNAVKFTDAGHVELRVSQEQRGDAKLWLQFEVEDSGVGIEPKDQERIFSAFEQAGDGVTREGSTGLGLAIAKNFVEMMGGKLQVQSQLGEGATFHFGIESVIARAKEVRFAKPKVPKKLARTYEGTRVLVVDDQDANRMLLVELLKPLGFEVHEATNGEEAVELFEQVLPQVVLMDRHMPVMDGLAATRRIKSTEAGAKTAIICVSASAFEEDVQLALSAGCCDFQSKPVSVGDLMSRIERHADLNYDDSLAVDSQGDAEPGEPAIPKPAKDEVTLGALPAELQEQLRKLALDCDSDAILELCDEIAEFDAVTAEAIRKLANDYRFDAVREMAA